MTSHGTGEKSGTFTRFEAWACNVSTFQDAALRKKLEFSLNDGTEIQRTVMRILGNLQESLCEAWLIISQNKVNESWPPQELSDSDEGMTMKSEGTSETQELSKAMENANTSLFEVSKLVRIISYGDDFLSAAAIYQLEFDPNVDICLIREQDGFDSGVDDWLITRLGKALTRRRQYLKYIETYTKGLMSCDNIAVAEEKPSISSHPLMAFENIQIEYDVPFQCPFCRMELVAQDHAAWKEHIFKDLKPYISWGDHLRSGHQINEKGSQLRALLLQSEDPVDDVSATACPFCDNWEESMAEATKDKYMRLMAFREHLGKHMEQLAFLSLPTKEGKM
ncbi:hypothetical protein BPOR_1830g00010 [Botrytis porri]|uniref:Oxidoreductase acuF-like C2H2 type zinc-finger domain-containing protein n=1 Tax=Botrytis porri TaxID=87229 RepID=A0A4Z1K919_9HELO|nr:hypothetical protein BPOR_1830g00010 [Botrytis porri]